MSATATPTCKQLLEPITTLSSDSDRFQTQTEIFFCIKKTYTSPQNYILHPSLCLLEFLLWYRLCPEFALENILFIYKFQ